MNTLKIKLENGHHIISINFFNVLNSINQFFGVCII
jgi:hypothetical protein